jgi:hypothetical protein
VDASVMRPNAYCPRPPQSVLSNRLHVFAPIIVAVREDASQHAGRIDSRLRSTGIRCPASIDRRVGGLVFADFKLILGDPRPRHDLPRLCRSTLHALS